MHESSIHERIWQFKLSDEIFEDPTLFFDKRAKEMAAAFNYRLVGTCDVKVQPSLNSCLVTGKALIEGTTIPRKGGRLPAKPKVRQ